MRFRRAIWGLALSLAIIWIGLAHAQEGGKEFAPKNGMYTIVMPDGKDYREIKRVVPLETDPATPKAAPANPKIKPKINKKAAPARKQNLAIEGSSSVSKDGTTSFLGASIAIPATIMRDIPQNRRFEVFRDLLANEMKGKITDEKEVKQDSVLGKEYTIEKPSGFARMRVHIIAGVVIYVLAEGKTKDDITSKTSDVFFASLKMTDKAQELFKQLNKDSGSDKSVRK